MQYMELIPKELQPVAGTDGAFHRRRRLTRQLPLYDQDPAQCRGLAEGEQKLMEEFVKKYKAEALGVGEVALPGQGGGGKEEEKPQDKSIDPGRAPESPNGALESAPAAGHYVSAGRDGMGLLGLLREQVAIDLVSTRGAEDHTSQGDPCCLVPILLPGDSPCLLQVLGHIMVLWSSTVREPGGTLCSSQPC